MSYINFQPELLQRDNMSNADVKFSRLQNLNYSDQPLNGDDLGLGAPKKSNLFDEKAEKYIRDSATIEDIPGGDDDDLDEEEDDDIIDLEEELEIDTDEVDSDELEIVESDSDDILVDDDDDEDDDDEDIL